MNHEAGIAAYRYERTVLQRALRRYGSFTAADFDRWLKPRSVRRFRPVSGETYILGVGRNGGTEWAVWLELLQIMAAIGEVIVEDCHSMIVYRRVTP